MRVVLLVLLFVTSACSAPAESAETTSTTIVAAATTTTEATTTTTTTIVVGTTITGSECVERDGVLYDSRGFVCPPRMELGTVRPNEWGPVGLQTGAPASQYQPGTYATRVFEPGFSFERTVVFRSDGETPFVTVLDQGQRSKVRAISPEVAQELLAYRFDGLEWVKDLSVSTVEYWGYTGTQLDFTTGDCPEINGCGFSIESVPSLLGWESGFRLRLLVVDVPNGPIGFGIDGPAYRFDQYWTEVAEPILASIEFSDG